MLVKIRLAIHMRRALSENVVPLLDEEEWKLILRTNSVSFPDMESEVLLVR